MISFQAHTNAGLLRFQELRVGNKTLEVRLIGNHITCGLTQLSRHRDNLMALLQSYFDIIKNVSFKEAPHFGESQCLMFFAVTRITCSPKTDVEYTEGRGDWSEISSESMVNLSIKIDEGLIQRVILQESDSRSGMLDFTNFFFESFVPNSEDFTVRSWSTCLNAVQTHTFSFFI
jgi:hypothetical protein